MTKIKTHPKEFRIYKPNSKNSGAASKFQCTTKYKKIGDKEYPEMVLFLESAPQTGTDDNGNASFGWSQQGKSGKSVTMKLGMPDIGEILLVLTGKTKFVGPSPKSGRTVEPGLFHKNKNGNTSLRLKWSDGKLYLNLSSQDSKKDVSKVGHSITPGEATVLAVLLESFVAQYHGWDHNLEIL
tara:strand:- start:548 stop:1096 length:549 start_codon:yes stop_codon:yes gene_type:complete